MVNQTFPSEFLLLGLSDFSHFQVLIFLFILIVYVAILVGNFLIISLVVSDPNLQTPMYFFLGNLSALDIFNSTISTSHLFFDMFSGNQLISYPTCVAQVFFFTWFVSIEAFMLEVMSYDRYVAICHPLHYTTMMNIALCVRVVIFICILNFFCALLHTLCILRLSFPHPTTIPGLFCEILQMIVLSCSDTYLNYLLLYIEALSLGLPGFFIIFFSYIYIFKTILKITLKDGRRRAYSTCTSHLSVVFLFYGTFFFNYFHPKTFLAGRLMSVFYSVFIPFLNPIIYSLRNSDLKQALRKTWTRIVQPSNQ